MGGGRAWESDPPTRSPQTRPSPPPVDLQQARHTRQVVEHAAGPPAARPPVRRPRARPDSAVARRPGRAPAQQIRGRGEDRAARPRHAACDRRRTTLAETSTDGGVERWRGGGAVRHGGGRTAGRPSGGSRGSDRRAHGEASSPRPRPPPLRTGCAPAAHSLGTCYLSTRRVVTDLPKIPQAFSNFAGLHNPCYRTLVRLSLLLSMT